MNWLKSAWAPVAAAGLMVIAILATISAARHKAIADAWRAKSVDIEAGNVVKGIETSEAANTQAKLHDNIADLRSETAKAQITKIGAKNEPMADILDNWSKS